jgi:TMEM175 potassium channel family protein
MMPAMASPRYPRRREENEIEFSRIVAFSDGVFAIAITLLVLTLTVPEHLPRGESLTDALWDLRHALLAYAISFAVIGRYWVNHHRFFSSVTSFDGRLLAINIFYLAWVVLLPFSTDVIGNHGGEAAAVILYAVNLVGVSMVGLWMALDAAAAGLSEIDPEEMAALRHKSLFVAAVFLASVPVALVVPEYAPLLWLALFLDPADRRARRRGAR